MKVSHCEQNIRPLFGSAAEYDGQSAACTEITANDGLTEEVSGVPQVVANMALRPTPRIRAMQANEWPRQGHATSPAGR